MICINDSFPIHNNLFNADALQIKGLSLEQKKEIEGLLFLRH
jgi:hypothetical protein